MDILFALVFALMCAVVSGVAVGLYRALRNGGR